MSYTTKQKNERRHRRHARVRTRIQGTAVCPRLAVFRSARHCYAQLIDDTASTTLAHADSRSEKRGTGVEVARRVGEAIARQAQDRSIARAVFDRGGFRYAGRVKAVAEGARAGGLQL